MEIEDEFFHEGGAGSRVPHTYSEKMILLKTIWNHSATSGGSVLFQAGVHFSREKVKCWSILAKFGKFWLFCRKFKHLLVFFYSPKKLVAYQN